MIGTNRKKPTSPQWRLLETNAHYTAWQSRKGDIALSSLVEVEDDHLPSHWEWLVSFSGIGGTVLTDAQVQEILQDFDMVDAEEDNHEKGFVRKFWLAVDEKCRVPCPCKDEETVTVGDYTYSRKKDIA